MDIFPRKSAREGFLFQEKKNIVLIEFVACYSVTNVKNKWLRKENEEVRDDLTTKMATERNVGK